MGHFGQCELQAGGDGVLRAPPQSAASWLTVGLGGRRWISLLVLAMLSGCRLAPTAEEPGCITVENPYAAGGSWYRGNFHMHSAHSDGAQFPARLVEMYGEAGYGVLCITDHNCFGDQDGGIVDLLQSDGEVHDWNGDGVLHAEREFGSGVEASVRDWTKPYWYWSTDTWYRPSDAHSKNVPVVISGCEATYLGWHIGLIGYPPGAVEPPNTNLECIARTNRAGGFVYLAHPAAWNNAPQVLARLLDMRSFQGIEIMNGLMQIAGQPADATPLWDGLLSSGYRLWGLGNDDEHTWPGAEQAPPFTAFDMVLAHSATSYGFLDALHRGSFYASTGVLFSRLEVDGEVLRVEAPLAERLRFIGLGGHVLRDAQGSSAEYVFEGRERYVRVEAIGKPVDGKSWPAGAWSQPFFVHFVPCSGPPN